MWTNIAIVSNKNSYYFQLQLMFDTVHYSFKLKANESWSGCTLILVVFLQKLNAISSWKCELMIAIILRDHKSRLQKSCWVIFVLSKSCKFIVICSNHQISIDGIIHISYFHKFAFLRDYWNSFECMLNYILIHTTSPQMQKKFKFQLNWIFI